MLARDNPFAVARLGALAYRFAAGAGPRSLDELLARFAALGRRAAIVGPMGHGKTTLLRELASRLAADGWRVRAAVLRAGERRLAAPARETLLRGIGRRDLLLVDGAQELSPLAWRRLLWASRRAGGLLVTSHSEGLLPTLHRCETSRELLASLVDELLAGASACPPAGAIPAAGELFARSGGDLRAALLAAYDAFAGLPSAPPLGRAESLGGLARSVSSAAPNASAQ